MFPQTKVWGNFYLRGLYYFIGDEDAEGVDATIINSWFTAVPGEPVNA